MTTHSQRVSRRVCLAGRLLILILTLATSVSAHDPGLSSLRLTASANHLEAKLTFSRSELAPLATSLDRPALEKLGSSLVEIESGGSSLPSHIEAIEINESSNAIHFTLTFPNARGSLLSVRSMLLSRLALGHRQFASLVDADGRVLHEQLLDARNSEFQASVSAARSVLGTFLQPLTTGIEHILTGYDHLAFLLALLLAATSVREVTRIITSFTIAHSITLAMAALDVVSITSIVVEPLIAVSIVFVGIENLLRSQPRGRWMLTFGFGLIHGFGFASALKEMGIGRGLQAAVPLLSFNLGVEAGQLAIAAAVLPLIWMLRRRPTFVIRLAPACSLLIALAGGYWLLVRTVLR
jgi:hydrogenase/urease accessory protein HupE